MNSVMMAMRESKPDAQRGEADVNSRRNHDDLGRRNVDGRRSDNRPHDRLMVDHGGSRYPVNARGRGEWRVRDGGCVEDDLRCGRNDDGRRQVDAGADPDGNARVGL